MTDYFLDELSLLLMSLGIVAIFAIPARLNQLLSPEQPAETVPGSLRAWREFTRQEGSVGE